MRERQFPAIAAKVEFHCSSDANPFILCESMNQLLKEILIASFEEQDYLTHYLSLISRIQTACKCSPANMGSVLGNTCFELYDKNSPALAQWGYQIALKIATTETNRNNLAYILRHHYSELRPSATEIIDLLLESVKTGSTLALINMALLFAQILNEERDWKLADDMLALVSDESRDFAPALSWWYQLDEEEDFEGALVLQWLSRHNKLPQDLTLTQKLHISTLKEKSSIPTWIFEKA